MFRGFRWQLPAFILALILFAAAMAYRISLQTSMPAARTSPPAPSAASGPTPPPAETPFPTAPALSSPGASNPRADREDARERARMEEDKETNCSC